MVRTWGFNDANYLAADTSLFTATYGATIDNNVKVTNTNPGGLTATPLSDDMLTGNGQVSVDGLLFNTTASSVTMRYRTATNASNTSGASLWNTTGSFYSASATVLPAVGATVNSAGGNVRSYLAVPVTSGTAFTLSVTYKQTSAGQTLGKVALIGSDNVILAAQAADYAQAGSTITYSGLAGHSLTSVRIFYSRDGAGGGGMNISQIVRTQ